MQVFDSNGPDVRIRGTAYQILEKYTALAKDAAAAGDRILSESYLQHAEHYQRVINIWQEANPHYIPPQQEQQADQPFVQRAEGAATNVPGADLGLPASILGGAPAVKAELESV